MPRLYLTSPYLRFAQRRYTSAAPHFTMPSPDCAALYLHEIAPYLALLAHNAAMPYRHSTAFYRSPNFTRLNSTKTRHGHTDTLLCSTTPIHHRTILCPSQASPRQAKTLRSFAERHLTKPMRDNTQHGYALTRLYTAIPRRRVTVRCRYTTSLHITDTGLSQHCTMPYYTGALPY